MTQIILACAAILCDDQHRVLITQRSDAVRHSPGQWETPGGVLEFGETPEDCVRREVWEELGVRISTLALFGVDSWSDSHRQIIIIIYNGKADGDFTLNHREIAAFRWITADEVDEYQFCMNCKERVIDFFRQHEGMSSS